MSMPDHRRSLHIAVGFGFYVRFSFNVLFFIKDKSLEGILPITCEDILPYGLYDVLDPWPISSNDQQQIHHHQCINAKLKVSIIYCRRRRWLAAQLLTFVLPFFGITTLALKNILLSFLAIERDKIHLRTVGLFISLLNLHQHFPLELPF